MKKIFKLLMLAIATSFALASCEDVPMSYPNPDGTGNENTIDNAIAPTGDGTAAAPFNVAGVKAFIDAGEFTGKNVYFTGIVTSFKSGEEPGNSYGNATFYIADKAESSNTFYCYRIKGFNNQKFTSADANLFGIGDTVTVCGNVTLYSGNTYETEQNTAYLVSVNGKGGQPAEPGADTPAEAKGSGTQADPYNVAAVLAYINTLGADKESANEVYIKGKVASNNTTDATISQYGNMTFEMVDEGSSATFMAYQVYGPGKKKFTAVSQIKEGDEVVVCGKVVNYKGNTPETVGKGQSYVVSINGQGDEGGNDEGGNDDQPTTGTEISCAKAVELCAALEDGAASVETYTVIGYITETDGKISRDQQVFWMADTKDGGKVFEAYWANIPDPTKALPVGTKVKMTGKLMRYGSTPEMKNGNVVILEMGDGGSTGGDDTGSGDTPAGDAGEYGIGVSYTLGANAYDDGKATINGTSVSKTIKIGTSKNPGDFTIKTTSGKLSFYAVTWKGAGTAEVKFMDGSNEVESVTVKANDGAAGNAPYTMSVSEGDKYEIELPAGKSITVTSDKRIIFFGLQEK